MISRDWAWGVVPSGFKKVVDGRDALMIVREDVAEFLTIEECTKRDHKDKNEPALFEGRGKLRGLKLRNGDTALIRPYRHGDCFVICCVEFFLLGRRGLLESWRSRKRCGDAAFLRSRSLVLA